MSGEQAETRPMPGSADRLRGELRDAVEQICRSGGGVVFEKFPGALQEERASDELAGSVAPRPGRGLIDAADDLAETLAQLEGTAGRIRPLRAGRGAQ